VLDQRVEVVDPIEMRIVEGKSNCSGHLSPLPMHDRWLLPFAVL
jgi:hypothetical protein